MLASPDAVVRYFNEIADLLTEYGEKQIDADRLVLTVRNVTLDVQVAARRESDGYAPYLATSDQEEVSETGSGFSLMPRFTAQPADDAGTVAASVRAILGEPDA